MIVWVAPAGGFAASAGTFITLAANLALHGARDVASAPPRRSAARARTSPGTLGEKVKNDAIAKITAIAEARHRQRRLGRLDRRSTPSSSPASEAVALGAVDGIAPTLEDVLAFANGKQVDGRRRQPVTLDLDGRDRRPKST